MTLTLEAGDYRLALDPARGGAIARFDWRGPDGALRPLMRPAQGPSVLDAACFPLVPFSNRIAHGQFRAGIHEVDLPPNFPGSDHPHPLHGFGWLAAWQVIEAAPERAVLEHLHEGGAWPWPYRARQTFDLSPQGLAAELSVTNLGVDPMPAGLGFHPYFPRDEDTVYRGLHRGEWDTGADGLPVALHRAATPVDWWHGAPVGSRGVDTVYDGRSGPLAIEWPARGCRLVLEPDDTLDRTVVYTPAGEPWFCVEPVSHATDAVNRPDEAGGMVLLAPGDRLSARLRFRAEAL